MDLEIYEELLLLRDDPDAFNKRASEVIEEYISSLDEYQQTKLRQYQWRIDGELRKYKDPVARYNKMIEMFWRGVNEFNESISTKD